MMEKATKSIGKKTLATIAASVISVASLGFASVYAENEIAVDVTRRTEDNVTTEEYVDNVKLGHFYDSKGNLWEFQKHFTVPVGDPNLETALYYNTLEEYYMGCGVTVRKCTCENEPRFVMPYDGMDNFGREEIYEDCYIKVPRIDDLLASTRGVLLKYIVHKIVRVNEQFEKNFMATHDYYPDYKIDVKDVIIFNKGYNNAPWCYIQTHDPILTEIVLNMPKDEFMSIVDSHEGEDEFFIGLNDSEGIELSAANIVQLAQDGIISEKKMSSFD